MRKGFFFKRKAAWRLKLRFKCLLLLMLVTGLWLMHRPLFAGLYNFLALEIQAKPADVLVVEGWVFDSGKRLAVDLYKRGFTKYIVTTGGPIFRNAACFKYETWAEVAKHYLVSSGISESRVIPVATQIRGTRQQALALRPVLKKLDAASVIIVTQKGHERRSYLAFRKAFQEMPIPVSITAADEEWFQADNWWRSHDGLIFLFTEYLSLLYYWFNGYI